MVAMKTVYGRIKVFKGFRSFVDWHVKDLKYHDLIADGKVNRPDTAISSSKWNKMKDLKPKMQRPLLGFYRA